MRACLMRGRRPARWSLAWAGEEAAAHSLNAIERRVREPFDFKMGGDRGIGMSGEHIGTLLQQELLTPRADCLKN